MEGRRHCINQPTFFSMTTDSQMTPREKRIAKTLVILMLAALALCFTIVICSLLLRRITMVSTVEHTLLSCFSFYMFGGLLLAKYKIHMLSFEISRRYGKEPYALILNSGCGLYTSIVVFGENVIGHASGFVPHVPLYALGFAISLVFALAQGRIAFPVLGSKYR